MSIISKLKRFVTVCQRMFTTRGLALLLGLMLGVMAPVLQAHAGLISCDGDPIVTLSNGLKLNLKVHLDISGSFVNQVVYTLHAPSNTSVVKVVFTKGPLQDKEVFHFVADQQSGQYVTDTIAYTQVSANVTAVMKATEPGLLGEITGDTETGTNNQDIFTSLSLNDAGCTSSTLLSCGLGL